VSKLIYVIVGLAGILGALARYGVGIAFGAPDPFPFATLAANLTGSFVLGWLLTSVSLWKDPHPWIKAGFGTGFIGAYTTFSTFSYETVRLAENQMWGTAVTYVLVSIWGGLLAVWIGHRLAERMFARPDERSEGGNRS
jgi:CrcB protein